MTTVYLWLVVLASWFDLGAVGDISRRNQARLQAERAYQRADFGMAAQLYAALLETSPDPLARLNFAHTLFHQQKYVAARRQYGPLMRAKQTVIATAATVQMGVLACIGRDSATALTHFRQALLQDPDNQPARFNYELVKQRFTAKNRPDSKKSKQKNRPDSVAKSSNQRVAQSTQQRDALRRLAGMNMSEEQALQLLDAMRDNDLPYALAQRGGRTEKPEPGRGNRW
jgi:tetratricopeptide (TPR) repeat protein